MFVDLTKIMYLCQTLQKTNKMNPKITLRMPKWQNLKKDTWPKELMMTFIGATLSIILTFGTAHILDEKQKREDARQTAMMVIHDMENSAKIFTDAIKEEETYFNLAQYVIGNIDRLDSISQDSIFSLVNYITAPAGLLYNYDDSSEKIFLSSQDAWKNINNATFIDAVQNFYHERRMIYHTLNSDKFFSRPITNDEYYELLLAFPDLQELHTTFMPDYLKKNINRNEVKMYISYSFMRRGYYSEYADHFESAANKCKFMMGITDEDLKKYVISKQRIGKPLTEKKLFGKWKLQTLENMQVEREYYKDHTSDYRIVHYMSYSYYTGQVEFKYNLRGLWHINGDSLITVIQPEAYEYEIDRSKIHYHPDMENVVNGLIDEWEQSLATNLKDMAKRGEKRNAAFVSIDATGNKIEMQYDETDNDGNLTGKKETLYMIRESEK